MKSISIFKAILIGYLIVNFPVLLIMFGIGAIGIIFVINERFWLGIACIILGFLLAWTWWSYTVPRWRRWAIKQGADADKLHRVAVTTGLEWPKGSIFEKTEFKLKDDE